MARLAAILVALSLLSVVAWRLLHRDAAAPSRPEEPRTISPGVRPHPPVPSLPTQLVPHPPTIVRVSTFGWGSGAQQLGRRLEPEAAHEGPMAIAAGPNGTLWVLDQVNRRVLRVDANGLGGAGFPVRTTAQDLRADGDGVAVLDRLGAQTLQRLGSDGVVQDERPLTSYGVHNPGGTTGIFADAAGALYLEESLVGEGRRVLHPVQGGEILAGRPNRAGDGLVAVTITARAAGELEVRETDRNGAVRFATALSVGRTILSLPLVDTDRRGHVYVGIVHAATTTGRDLSDERLELVRLGPSGVPLARTAVPHPANDLETFRELAVTDDGAVVWMHPLADDGGEVVEQISF